MHREGGQGEHTVDAGRRNILQGLVTGVIVPIVFVVFPRTRFVPDRDSNVLLPLNDSV